MFSCCSMPPLEHETEQVTSQFLAPVRRVNLPTLNKLWLLSSDIQLVGCWIWFCLQKWTRIYAWWLCNYERQGQISLQGIWFYFSSCYRSQAQSHQYNRGIECNCSGDSRMQWSAVQSIIICKDFDQYSCCSMPAEQQTTRALHTCIQHPLCGKWVPIFLLWRQQQAFHIQSWNPPSPRRSSNHSAWIKLDDFTRSRNTQRFIHTLHQTSEIIFDLLLQSYISSLDAYQNCSIGKGKKEGMLKKTTHEWEDSALHFAGDALEKFQAAETMQRDNLPNKANTTVQQAMGLLKSGMTL